MAAVYKPAAPGLVTRFEHTRPIFIVEDLEQLHGPSRGVVRLPIHLDWTPGGVYDLSSDADVRSMYTIVLREALSEADLAEHLDGDLLRSHWASLLVPEFVRETWESMHPALQPAEEA